MVLSIYSNYSNDLINKLRHKASPGSGVVTAKPLQQGKADMLYSHLVSLFNIILSVECHHVFVTAPFFLFVKGYIHLVNYKPS
jgi:hypothetical protein